MKKVSESLFILLICSTFCSRIYLSSASGCRHMNFDPYLAQGKALVNHVIDELTLPTDQMCRIKCYLNHDCVSYNLGPSSTPGMMTCQLNDADRYQYPQDYQDTPGYSYRGAENKCADAPCTTVNQTCQAGFKPDGYRCLCPKGFTGVNCEIDIDECSSTSTNNCSSNTSCINTPGSYKCTCKPGFTGDGVICTDIDECSSSSLNNCSSHAACINKPGSFICTCKPGFEGDGVDCADIDECSSTSLNNCSLDTICTNTPGSYKCTRKSGTTGGDASGADERTDILDKVECSSSSLNCSSNETCTNSTGTVNCTCKAGFVGNGTKCTDIDECSSTSLNNCSSYATCTNTPGSHQCTCKPGFTGDGINCNGNGLSCAVPAKTCSSLKTAFPATASGVYCLDPDSDSTNNNSFMAYCDMVTVGGGWTLVWAYTFLVYSHFNTFSNAVTPGPKHLGRAVLSETAPQNETDYNAIDFLLWSSIGSEFMVKSNINNWVACVPGTGSLVTKTKGSVTCRMVKIINTLCTVVPYNLGYTDYGIFIKASSSHYYYYFDTDPVYQWPTHDPCGLNKPNQLKNVPNPHGNIYLR